MEAIEFITKPLNGSVKLPIELSHIDNEIKVIVLFNSNSSKMEIKNDSNFSALKLKTKGNTFNREFANDR